MKKKIEDSEAFQTFCIIIECLAPFIGIGILFGMFLLWDLLK